MLSRISFVCASAVVATVLSVPSFARGKTNTAHAATVTGCLAQGDEPNEYAIKTENGKIYGLSSSTVDLVKHMNHRVTVTGAVTGQQRKEQYHFDWATGRRLSYESDQFEDGQYHVPIMRSSIGGGRQPARSQRRTI